MSAAGLADLPTGGLVAQHLLHANGFGIRVTDPLVEVLDAFIVASDQELDFPAPARLQPLLGGLHHATTKATFLLVGIDSHVVHPAAMAILADHGARDNPFILFDDKNR